MYVCEGHIQSPPDLHIFERSLLGFFDIVRWDLSRAPPCLAYLECPAWWWGGMGRALCVFLYDTTALARNFTTAAAAAAAASSSIEHVTF